MSNREIVQQGLNARKDVRAAEARAEKFRQDATDQSDARFYERNKHRLERADWLEEKTRLLWQIDDQKRSIRSLVKERDELIQRESERHYRQTLLGAAKAILTALLLITARDLGWVAPWLTTVLLCSCTGFLGYAFYKLARKK